jgi:hypothetical protein
MPKFRKRPVVIEAFQWFSEMGAVGGVEPLILQSSSDGSPEEVRWVIHTLEGMHQVSEGDWIITGVKGEKYPCKSEIFVLTYETVEDD